MELLYSWHLWSHKYWPLTDRGVKTKKKRNPHRCSERCWHPHGAPALCSLGSSPRSCRSPSLWTSCPQSPSCWCRVPCLGHCVAGSGYLNWRRVRRSCTMCSWPCPAGWRRRGTTAWGPDPFGWSRCPCWSPAWSGRSGCSLLCAVVSGWGGGREKKVQSERKAVKWWSPDIKNGGGTSPAKYLRCSLTSDSEKS